MLILLRYLKLHQFDSKEKKPSWHGRDIILFREVRTFILVFKQEGEQVHLRSQSILPCPGSGSQKPPLSTLQQDWLHAWFKAGLHTCWKGCVKRCRAVCSPTYHPIHTLVQQCWEDPARGLKADAALQTHRLAGSHVFRLQTVHPMFSFTCIRESRRTPYIFIG